jgi:hypothetical protein
MQWLVSICLFCWGVPLLGAFSESACPGDLLRAAVAAYNGLRSPGSPDLSSGAFDVQLEMALGVYPAGSEREVQLDAFGRFHSFRHHHTFELPGIRKIRPPSTRSRPATIQKYISRVENLATHSSVRFSGDLWWVVPREDWDSVPSFYVYSGADETPIYDSHRFLKTIRSRVVKGDYLNVAALDSNRLLIRKARGKIYGHFHKIVKADYFIVSLDDGHVTPLGLAPATEGEDPAEWLAGSGGYWTRATQQGAAQQLEVRKEGNLGFVSRSPQLSVVWGVEFLRWPSHSKSSSEGVLLVQTPGSVPHFHIDEREWKFMPLWECGIKSAQKVVSSPGTDQILIFGTQFSGAGVLAVASVSENKVTGLIGLDELKGVGDVPAAGHRLNIFAVEQGSWVIAVESETSWSQVLTDSDGHRLKKDDSLALYRLDTQTEGPPMIKPLSIGETPSDFATVLSCSHRQLTVGLASAAEDGDGGLCNVIRVLNRKGDGDDDNDNQDFSDGDPPRLENPAPSGTFSRTPVLITPTSFF